MANLEPIEVANSAAIYFTACCLQIVMLSLAPEQNLPVFKDHIVDTYTSTYVAHYKIPAIKDKTV